MSEATPLEPPEHESELRQLYRERNARIFATPLSGSRFALGSKRGGIILMMLLTLVVGLLVSFVTTTFLQPTLVPQTVERPVRLLSSGLEVTSDLITRLSGSAVAVLAARPAAKNASLNEQVYLANEALGQALVLSSDGWLVTTQAVVSDPKRAYVVATAENRLLPVELVILDPVVPLVYLKIAAANLTATPFAEFANVEQGQQVVAVALASQSSNPSVYLRHLSALQAPTVVQRNDLAVSSEYLPDRYMLDRALPAQSLGAPIANGRGEVVGLATLVNGEVRAVLPLDNLSVMIDNLFSERLVRRPTLGLTYTQSSWLKSFLPATVPVEEGALVVAGSKRQALVPKGPAAAAGVREGDIIIALAGERLGRRSLSALLQQYRPGDKVELQLERQDKELRLMVTLGEVVARASAAAEVQQKK